MKSFLEIATEAVREAGELLKSRTGGDHVVQSATEHDLKLEMDAECHALLSTHLLKKTPGFSILSEEGEHGDPQSEHRWIVDPIDGTVNFFYGLPHYCITVALQKKSASGPGAYETIAGVTFDPVRDEWFTAERGRGAFLNGRPIRVSVRRKIGDAIMAIGFSKTSQTAKLGMGYFQDYTQRARKLRVMGSAALDLAYVAAGRLDAYYELVRIWDIAAGLLLVSEAGGRVHTHPMPTEKNFFATLAFNGSLPFRLNEERLEETAQL